MGPILNLMAKRKALDLLKEYAEIYDLHFEGRDMTDVNDATPGEDRPLHFAVMRRSVEEVNILLAAGADPNGLGDLDRTPLHAAINSGSADDIDVLMVEALMAAGADPNLVDRLLGDTPLGIAARRKRDDLVALMTRATDEGP